MTELKSWRPCTRKRIKSIRLTAEGSENAADFVALGWNFNEGFAQSIRSLAIVYAPSIINPRLIHAYDERVLERDSGLLSKIRAVQYT